MPREPGARLALFRLLVAAGLLFAAGSATLSLASLDDAFYARKGIEMSRTGAFFDVTWAGAPALQNPPLHFWILARSFAWFGETDAAARLPSMIMGLGVLLVTYRLGVRLFDRATALTGVALLLTAPAFVNEARGVMLDLPLTFWTGLVMLLYVTGRHQPFLHVLTSLPLAAALLTKSLLGLLPLAVAGAWALWSGRRAAVRPGWMWAGAGAGLLLGLSWTVHLWSNGGIDAVRAHYLGEIGARAAADFSLVRVLFGYPLILFREYQPIVLPGLAGVAMIVRRAWRRPDCPEGLLAFWVIVPMAVYSLSAAQAGRYLLPMLPALALCGATWLVHAAPAVASALRQWLVPGLAVAIALAYTVAPDRLTRDLNRSIKHQTADIRRATGSNAQAAYYGDRYWSVANPFLYYAELLLDPPAPTAADALSQATRRSHRLLVVDRSKLPDIDSAGATYEILLDAPDWVLLRIA